MEIDFEVCWRPCCYSFTSIKISCREKESNGSQIGAHTEDEWRKRETRSESKRTTFLVLVVANLLRFWRVTWEGVFQTDSAYICECFWMNGKHVWLNFRNLFTSQSGKAFPWKLMCAFLHLNHWNPFLGTCKWIKWNTLGERVHYFCVSLFDADRSFVLSAKLEHCCIIDNMRLLSSEWRPLKAVTGNWRSPEGSIRKPERMGWLVM